MAQLYVFVLTFGLMQFSSNSNVWAQSTGSSPNKQQSEKQLDMNQFDQLKPRPKPAESGVNIQTTCTTPQGTLIKKGERGFDTCLANAQSPVMNQPRETEKENDPRKQ